MAYHVHKPYATLKEMSGAVAKPPLSRRKISKVSKTPARILFKPSIKPGDADTTRMRVFLQKPGGGGSALGPGEFGLLLTSGLPSASIRRYSSM